MRRNKVDGRMAELGQVRLCRLRLPTVRLSSIVGIALRRRELPQRAKTCREQAQQTASLFDHLVGTLLQDYPNTFASETPSPLIAPSRPGPCGF